ncbi:DUF1173 family protein [Rhizobium binxianense]
MTRRIRIGTNDLDLDDSAIDERLAAAFSRREHPICLCCTEGVVMYIARLGDRHILKRMPGTGGRHDPDCDSYEPPSGLSGLGTVEGEAIVENIDDGTTLLKLGFLSRNLPAGPRRRRAAPPSQETSGPMGRGFR